MTQSDDKPRGTGIREASKLRAMMGSDPSSGYAFHDQVRVDRVERTRTPRTPTPSAQVASHAPRERSFAQTLVGGVTIQEALRARDALAEPPSDNDQHVPRTSLPQVPVELVGSAEEEPPFSAAQARAESPGSADKPVSSKPPAVPQGGAIWSALPSVVHAPSEISVSELNSPEDAQPDPVAHARVSSQPPHHSRPAGYRPSAAELEAEHSHAYADNRLLKYEALVERNAWEQLREELSHEAALSPALRLLSIIAQREALKGDHTPEHKQQAARLTQQAIEAVAALLHVPTASPTALVIGKRLLRQNRGAGHRPAPSAGLSISVMIGGLAAGAGLGWLVTTILL